jgi:hypothetical protein
MADDQYKSELEKQFPRIVSAVITLWSDIEMRPFFDKLVIDQRAYTGPQADAKPREGFPAEVLEEILLLASMNRILHPSGWNGDPDATRPPIAFGDSKKKARRSEPPPMDPPLEWTPPKSS